MVPAMLIKAPSMEEETAQGLTVTWPELFYAFGLVGLCGFGGVMPWAHRMLVEQRRWLTDEEFVNMLSLCQFLPGGNVLNLSICVGSRFAGLRGSIAAFAGLMAMPTAIVIGLAMLYSSYGQIEPVQAAFRGISSAAAGLIVGMGIKIAYPLRRSPRAIVTGALVIVAILVFELPLAWVLLGGVPVSIFAAWMSKR